MKKNCFIIISALTCAVLISGFAGKKPDMNNKGDSGQASLDVAANNTFKSVIIGDQEWMAMNLNVTSFRNGDPIPEAATAEEWERAGDLGQPAWCWFQNNPGNPVEYGKLYNFFAVNDPRGLAPEGWHVASAEEWTQLTDFLGGESVAGKKMKNTTGWADNNEQSGNGTNESGFSGYPGGYRYDHSAFGEPGKYSPFWTTTKRSAKFAWQRSLNHDRDGIQIYFYSLRFGAAVRCVKD